MANPCPTCFLNQAPALCLSHRAAITNVSHACNLPLQSWFWQHAFTSSGTAHSPPLTIHSFFCTSFCSNYEFPYE
jgi:hypothetical protein